MQLHLLSCSLVIIFSSIDLLQRHSIPRCDNIIKYLRSFTYFALLVHSATLTPKPISFSTLHGNMLYSGSQPCCNLSCDISDRDAHMGVLS